MKQFEQLAIVLAALMGYRKKGDLKGGLELIEKAYSDIPGFDTRLLEESNNEEFLKALTAMPDASFQKIDIIAGFISEEADFLFLSGNQLKAKNCCNKALILYDYLDKHERIYSFERNQRISRIRKIMTLMD